MYRGRKTILKYKYSFSSDELSFQNNLTDSGDPDISPSEPSVRTQDGSVWTVDNLGHQIVQFNSRTGLGIVHHYGSFGHVTNIAWGRDPSNTYGASSDYLFVLDEEAHELVRLHLDIIPGDTDLVVDRRLDLGENSWVGALDVDGFGNLYLADFFANEITKLSPDFEMLGTFGSPGKGPGQFVNITSLSNPQGVRAGDLFVTEAWSDTTGGDWYIIDVDASFVQRRFADPHEIAITYLATDYHYQNVKVERLVDEDWETVQNFEGKVPRASGNTTLMWSVPEESEGRDYQYRFTIATESTYHPEEGDPQSDTVIYQDYFGNYNPYFTEPLAVPGRSGGCLVGGEIYYPSTAATDEEHPEDLSYRWSIEGNENARIRPDASSSWDGGPLIGIGLKQIQLWVPALAGKSPNTGQPPVDLTVQVTDPGGSYQTQSGHYGVCEFGEVCSCSTTLVCDCPCYGDPNCDGVISVVDVTKCVDVAFRSVQATFDSDCLKNWSPISRTDVDCTEATNVLDVVRVVAAAFRNDVTPLCNPCD